MKKKNNDSDDNRLHSISHKRFRIKGQTSLLNIVQNNVNNFNTNHD